MKIVISGGGTGGHIYPGITLATTLKSMDPNHQILFVGTERGLESDVVPRAGFDLKLLNLSGIPRHLSLQMFVSI
ncbi:MAG: glycosyltransferase, partial [Neobacillus sp.]